MRYLILSLNIIEIKQHYNSLFVSFQTQPINLQKRDVFVFKKVESFLGLRSEDKSRKPSNFATVNQHHIYNWSE
jgi:hypothetical protein